MDEFTGSEQVRFALYPQGIFHPKAFLFWNEDRWELCVGSANLTQGAMGPNQELVLHVTSDTGSHSVQDDLLLQIKEYWKAAEVISKNDASAYRSLWSVQQGKRGSASSKHWTHSKSIPPVRIEIMYMSWDDFVRGVITEDEDFFEKRCIQIKDASDAFRSQESLVQMDSDTRKMIAGLPNRTYLLWACFGSMKGAGTFSGLVNQNNSQLSLALDQIPLEGPVLRDDYNAYIDEFMKAFQDKNHRIATATRLLAMKRPDNFICFDNQNRVGLCKSFGISVNRMDYERYWDEVILQLRDSVWWNAPIPSEMSERIIWEARAAMLDALFYEHKH